MPFLKEEKSEHECARQYEIAIQLVCARHCELPLSKMGSKGLFPGRVSEANQGRGQPRRGYRRPKPATHSGAGRESRRAAGFLWYFLSLRKKVLPPAGRQPHRPRRSRRVIPSLEKGGLRLRAHQRAFLSPLWNTRVSKVGEKPIRRQVPIRADAAHQAPRRFFRQSWLTPLLAGGFPLAPAPLRAVPAR